MFTFKLKAKDFPILNKKDEKLTEVESLNRLNNILLTLQNSVAEVTPVGARGDLRASLKTKVRRLKLGKIKGALWYAKKYASSVNDGRKASPVSEKGQRSLKRWIQKSTKGRAYFSGLKNKYPNTTINQAVFVLARSLKNKARKGQKFFEKGIKNAEPDINRMVRKLGTILVRGWAR